MSRRTRALAFAFGALACAGLAAGIAGGHRSDVATHYGGLRPVVVTREPVGAQRALRADVVERLLDVRRVPERFVPPDALADPVEAIGRRPRARMPAGSYVTASQLADPKPRRSRREQRTGPGKMPVEIAVAAAGAIAGPREARSRLVDVVVTSEPAVGRGRGRTYVAARGVRLLDLRSAGADAAMERGAGIDAWVATLALDRAEALRLIEAESFARQIRLIGSR